MLLPYAKGTVVRTSEIGYDRDPLRALGGSGETAVTFGSSIYEESLLLPVVRPPDRILGTERDACHVRMRNVKPLRSLFVARTTGRIVTPDVGFRYPARYENFLPVLVGVGIRGIGRADVDRKNDVSVFFFQLPVQTDVSGVRRLETSRIDDHRRRDPTICPQQRPASSHLAIASTTTGTPACSNSFFSFRSSS